MVYHLCCEVNKVCSERNIRNRVVTRIIYVPVYLQGRLYFLRGVAYVYEFPEKASHPQEVKQEFPLSEAMVAVKAERDRQIREVFEGKSDKFLLIIGPCSADHKEPVLEYISRLRRLDEQVSDKLILIPRIYTNKPRTTGQGYKGMLHQPDPESIS